MKLINNINKVLLIITIILDFTIIFGLYAQILLGFTQLCIALYISFNFKRIEKNLKYQIINYWIYVFLYFSVITYLFMEEKKTPKWKTLLKKYGWLGILFFSVKGTLSLIAIIWGANALKGCM